MAKQIINFKPTGQKTNEGWDKINLLLDREVFLDLPLCIIDWGVNYKEPILVGAAQNMPLVFEAEEVRSRLKESEKEDKKIKLKTFHLSSVDGKLQEVESSKASWSGELPEDTDLEELSFGTTGELIKTVKVKE